MPVSVTMMTEVQRPPESLYRKVINPGLDIINHANKLGIRLKSTSALRTPVPPLLAGDRDALSPRQSPLYSRARSRSSPHRFAAQNQPPQYIHNVVVPLPLVSSDLQQTLYRSLTTTPNSFHSSKVRNNSLPLVSRGTRVSTAKTNTTVKSMGTSLYTDKYLSTTPSERLLLDDSEDVSKWNTSSQALRYEVEKRNLSKSRTMKRLSEIQTHRIDRMYYLSASPAPIHAKYNVDQEDLRRLKDLSRARHTTPHYGRGLSSADTEDRERDQQTPRPTPVSNTPQPNLAEMPDQNETGEKNQETFITQAEQPDHADETAEQPNQPNKTGEQDRKATSDVDSLATLPANSEKGDATPIVDVATVKTSDHDDEVEVQSEATEWAKLNTDATADVTSEPPHETQNQVDEEAQEPTNQAPDTDKIPTATEVDHVLVSHETEADINPHDKITENSVDEGFSATDLQTGESEVLQQNPADTEPAAQEDAGNVQAGEDT